MLSWVREKLAEGRLRWQQSVVQQPQRNSTPSPPPLPPPSAIVDLPSAATTPVTGHHPFNRISFDDSLDVATPQPQQQQQQQPSPTAISNSLHRLNNAGSQQSHSHLQQDNQIDTIKTATSSNLKRYSHISRLSQR